MLLRTCNVGIQVDAKLPGFSLLSNENLQNDYACKSKHQGVSALCRAVPSILSTCTELRSAGGILVRYWGEVNCSTIVGVLDKYNTTMTAPYPFNVCMSRSTTMIFSLVSFRTCSQRHA